MNQREYEESKRKTEVREFISKTRKEMGWVDKKKPEYQILRTAILAYKELHGIEYQLPAGTIIIED